MNDGPSAIDPLVAAGPSAPVENLRPAPSLQRVLMLDGPTPMMADLATGDFRPYENGPPVSVPMVSTRYDAATFARLQVQVLRDPRPTSVTSTLWSLHLGDEGLTLDVIERPGGRLELCRDGAQLASAPIGLSPAVVVVLETARADAQVRLVIHARNADAVVGISSELTVASTNDARLTVGGPTSEVTGTHGRRRLIPVLVDATRPVEPVDQLRRAVRGARRVAGSLRDRLG